MSISSSGERNEPNPNVRVVKKDENETLTPVKAIRAYCLGCSCGSAAEVRLCPVKNCELYRYREGHNPNRKSAMSEEQRKAASERMRRLNGQP